VKSSKQTEETFPGSKKAKLFPEVLSDEREVCRSFAAELAEYLAAKEDLQQQVEQFKTLWT
jgi:hypothetical protein